MCDAGERERLLASCEHAEDAKLYGTSQQAGEVPICAVDGGERQIHLPLVQETYEGG